MLLKRITLSFLFLLCLHINYAQQNYFQQEVNYQIDVTLNDVKHELSAFEKIEYINKSSTSLNFIYFHLWPNAYKNNETALAKQLLAEGSTVMYFAKEKDLGYIDSLNFMVNGKSVKWESDPEHLDICKLILNQPLKSLDTLFITTPFHVKLPSAKISRLGHIGQAYAITQWYPKPAVFDKDGWHQMPYLNQGEFYSEFGSFKVNITLPKNYVLAATGDRINEPEEEQWLQQNVEATEKMIAEKKYSHDNSFPESSKEQKTITFQQYRVHDFAWFADKRFHALKGECLIPKNGNRINSWAFFTNSEPELWANSLEYIEDATSFYSAMNGDYPYNHVTAIDGTISAGGGMEYPNITIIGNSGNKETLETTIMHEVGHNWFYGILGSNEREYPFLDEGLNSFYEMRYIRNKYPNQTIASLFGKDSTFKFFGLNQFKQKTQYYYSYLLSALNNTDQPINSEVNQFTEFNYGAIVYSKSALVFDYLMNYLGKDKFDEAMQFYFDQWKFKHPTPKDLIQTLSYHLNADFTWFENELLNSNNKIDYKILNHLQLEDHSHVIGIKNIGDILGPVSVSGYKQGQLVGTIWYNGFKGTKVFEFPPSDIDKFVIDGDEFIPEINKQNNTLKTTGLFKRTEPLQFNLLGKLDNAHYTQLNFLPIAGYNVYNKFMLGCAFYNYSLLPKKIEFTLAPMYAFGNKTITGFADFTKHVFPKNKLLQEITFIAKAKSFSHNYIDATNFNNNFHTSVSNFNLNYIILSGTLDAQLKKKTPRSPITQHIGYNFNQLFVDKVVYSFGSTNTIEKKTSSTIINNLYYTLNNKRAINPFSLKVNLQHNDLFGKASAELNYHLTVAPKHSFEFRLFAGIFIYGTAQEKGAYRFRMSGFNGYQDYLFNANYIGRNDMNGLSFAQFTENDGAFKVWTPLGQTSKWLVALNIKSPKLGKLPLKFFADIGTSEFNESLLNDKILYCAGVDISLIKNIFEIYVPLTYSKDIKNTLALNNKGNFIDAIRFTLNLHLVNPKNFIARNLF